MKAEHVLAVRNQAVLDIEKLNGSPVVSATVIDATADALPPESLIIAQREWLETNEAYRQLIPYSVILNDKNEALLYERTGKSGEKRLAGSMSIGFGGHVDLADILSLRSQICLSQTLELCCERELEEEIESFIGIHRLTERRGFILENDTPVGRVHLGVLYTFEVTNSATIDRFGGIKSQDPSIEMHGWVPLEELVDNEALEGWSRASARFLVEALCEKEV